MTTVEQIQQYAACVFAPGDIVEIRCLASGGKVRKFWRRAEDLAGLVPELERLNSQGYNVYCGPNPRKGDGLSGDENVTVCRCLFVDFDKIAPGDGCSLVDFVETRIFDTGLPIPNIEVFSGHGLHAFWRLAEPMAPVEWSEAQARMIATLGSDPVIKNPERFMRLPGFANHKPPKADCFLIYTMGTN